MSALSAQRSCESLRKIVKWSPRASSSRASRSGQELARRLQASPRIDVLENVGMERRGRQVVRGPFSWPWCGLGEGCRSRVDWVGTGSGRPRTRRSLKLIKRNLTSRFARLAKRCDREHPPRAQAAPVLFWTGCARPVCDFAGCQRNSKVPNAGTRVRAAAYIKSLKDSSAQNRTIAKSRGSLAGRTVLHKSSFRRAAYLFRKAKLPVKRKTPQGRTKASINPGCGKRETIASSAGRNQPRIHADYANLKKAFLTLEDLKVWSDPRLFA